MERVEVAAAVILRPDGGFLLGRRPPSGFYPGYWEFPGGKVEPNETPTDALCRELKEELGIKVELAYPWITREFHYPHANVRLHFFRVLRWSGDLRLLQHDALEWQRADRLTVSPLLPANAPVLAALGLPDFYAISHADEIGIDHQLEILAEKLKRGLRLVQLRETRLATRERAAFVSAAVAICHRFSARVLVSAEEELAENAGADGVHLPAVGLMSHSARPAFPLVAASCHDERELAQAASLGLDFVVLGPVKETASHPGKPGLGWDNFARLIANYPLPVYALGGLTSDDREAALAAGAHGIAAIRAAWV